MKLFLHILAVVVLAIFASGYVQKEAQDEYENYQPIPYEFNYEVHDAKTGDQKSHHENREGDVVKGYYSLREADGTLREVHYTADKINGFNAVVKKTGTPVYPKEPIQKGERNYDYVQNVHQSPHFY